ncbi:ATP-dependent helicase [Candidatus Dependentiae bacterium]
MTDQANSFNQFLATHLNEEQKKAVTAKRGVFLVVAGAGSGKTRVITARIAHLILNEDAQPSSIVALTFTNKAANEMKERVQQFLPAGHPLPFVGTFHSYCLRILKENSNLLEVPFVSIFDQDDKLKLLSDIIKRNGIGKRTTAKKLSHVISQIKNSMVGTDANSSDTFIFSMPFVKDVFAAYEQEKTASKCLDFDDLLVQTLQLFEKNSDFKSRFQESIAHILVDEYQDTNTVQHALLKHMAIGPKKTFIAQSLCIVGDEDQSIYSWRGATVANIINFRNDFPKTKTIKVEQNYRSVQPILHVANHVIKNNVNRNPKKLWTEKNGNDRVRVITCMSEYQEGDVVAQFLKTAQEKQPLSNTAVLYRAHYQSRALEEALIRNALPYKIIGGIQFYERKEIKDILAYLRLVVNPFDRSSFFRVINCPARGLGAKFEELFHQHWNSESFFNFKDVAKDLLHDEQLTRTKADALKTFLNIFNIIDREEKPSAAIEKIIVGTAYLTHIKNSYDQNEAQARIDNVKELIRSVKYLEEQGSQTISAFLDEVALMQEKTVEGEEEKDAVLLMTLHAAKGLEFDTVIIIGLEDGLLPSSRSFIDSDALEEERRLFYVGITRAKERLLLTHSKYRYTYGQMTTQPPSRFLAELPTRYFAHDDCSHDHIHQIDALFRNWLGFKTKAFKQPEVFTFGAAKKATGPTKKPSSGWKKNQPVQHKKFGVGVVQKIEQKTAGTVYLTVKFKSGKKKLDSKFVVRI